MLSEQLCKKLDRSPWDLKVPDCCKTGDSGDPGECDCCYDEWQKKLEEVVSKFSGIEEQAKVKVNELSFIKERRNTLKAWYDELVNTNEKSREICDTLDVMLNQIEKIYTNTGFAVNALKIIYCMLRDFYMQLDKLKMKHDQLLNCIRCLSEPTLAPGQGIMKCIEDYGKKLEILIASRDELLKKLLEVISLSLWINKNLAKEYGLYAIIKELREIVKWDMNCDDDTPAQGQNKFRQEGITSSREQGQGEKECPLEPLIPTPTSSNTDYCRYIWHKYWSDKTKAEALEKELLDINKEKEALEACKKSLAAAIAEVDPKNRC